MKKIIFIIWSVLSLSSILAQDIPWSANRTQVTMNMYINTGADIEVQEERDTLTQNDAIGFFYDSAGTQVISNFGIWQQVLNGTTVFNIYGDTVDDGIKTGFFEEEAFQVKIYKYADQCVIENVVEIATGLNKYRANRNDSVTRLVAKRSAVAYGTHRICKGSSPTLRPIQDGTINDLSFSSTTGLILDSTTGIIDVTNSPTGQHSIVLNSSSCLQDTTLSLLILPQLLMNSVGLTIIEKIHCGESEGIASFDSSFVSNYSGILTYFLRRGGGQNQQGLPQINNDGFFEFVGPGINTLIVQDTNFCEANIEFIMDSLACPNQTDEYILSPNLNSHSEVKLPCDGSIKIFNRTGQLVKTLNQVLIWDGKDENDYNLPIGVYIAFCENRKIAEISILR